MIIVVLPAYNEEAALEPLLGRLDAALGRYPAACVIVVDDGSTDGTVRVAREHGGGMEVVVVSHPANQGLGRTMRTGLERALEVAGEGDVVVTMDADNTHDPEVIHQMLPLVEDGFDIVIASRYHPGGGEEGLSWHRSLMSRAASVFISLWAPVRGAKDYTCGYRAYSARILRDGQAAYGWGLVEERGFTCMAELLLKLSARGARVAEVPLVLRYDLKAGPSKMKVARTIGRYLWLAARHRRRRVPA